MCHAQRDLLAKSLTGLPLHFPCRYWVDKYLFLHFYRKPPHYSHHMSVTASKLTAFPALLVHLATSIWMLGNRAIFSSAINEKGNALVSKAYQPHR